MKAKHRFILAVIVLGLLMTGPFLVTSLLVWLDMKEAERQMLTELLMSRLPVGTMRTLHKDLSLAPPQDGRRRSRAPRYGVSVSSTMRTSCAKDEAPIFSMTRARWISTVR